MTINGKIRKIEEDEVLEADGEKVCPVCGFLVTAEEEECGTCGADLTDKMLYDKWGKWN